jgi:polar amino acid transport system substrate-binding protein
MNWILMLLSISFASAAPAEESLVVEVSPFEPSVIQKDDGSLTGFDIELWDEIANRAGINYTYHTVPFGQILEDLHRGKADVGLAGISMTEAREKDIDFSFPYLNASLHIMVRSEKEFDTWATLRSFLNTNVLMAFVYLLLFVALCGHVVWFAERGQDAISDEYFPGIFESFWWAFVTMTTVGYGDIAPRKWLGRLIAVVVMFAGIAFFGWFIAILAASVETESLKSKIESPRDLFGVDVATKKGTTSDIALQKANARIHYHASIANAAEALASGKVQAVVMDKPALEYFLKRKGRNRFALVGKSFALQHYGIAFAHESPLREQVNQALLHLIEDGTYGRLFDKYFGH